MAEQEFHFKAPKHDNPYSTTYEDYNGGDILECLIGKKIQKAWINASHDVVLLETDNGNLFLNWEGDCCSKCFINHLDGSENLENSVIVKANNLTWKDVKRDEQNYEIVQSMGTQIETSRGVISFETRLEHNGYYSGWICVSSECPLDQYGGYIQEQSFKPLADF